MTERLQCLMARRIFAALVLLALAAVALSQPKVYVALGDSLGWGYQPDNVTPSEGDKGYVRGTADWLGAQQGTRPVLTNLSIPGETSASFFNTSEIGAILNTNYPLFFRKSQSQTFLDRVASHQAAGRIVETVTLDIGGNDLLDLLDSTFLAKPFTEQQAIADTAINAARPNVRQALAVVRNRLPLAKIVLAGYYNPYAAFPGSAEDRISAYAIPRLNHMLFIEAKRIRISYASSFTDFVGHELEYTWIGEGDIHCRNAGYAVMASAVTARLARPLPVISP